MGAIVANIARTEPDTARMVGRIYGIDDVYSLIGSTSRREFSAGIFPTTQRSLGLTETAESRSEYAEREAECLSRNRERTCDLARQGPSLVAAQYTFRRAHKTAAHEAGTSSARDDSRCRLSYTYASGRRAGGTRYTCPICQVNHDTEVALFDHMFNERQLWLPTSPFMQSHFSVFEERLFNAYALLTQAHTPSMLYYQVRYLDIFAARVYAYRQFDVWNTVPASHRTDFELLRQDVMASALNSANSRGLPIIVADDGDIDC